MKKPELEAVTARSAAALLREAVKRTRGDALAILAGMDDLKARERLAVQMIWGGPGFEKRG